MFLRFLSGHHFNFSSVSIVNYISKVFCICFAIIVCLSVLNFAYKTSLLDTVVVSIISFNYLLNILASVFAKNDELTSLFKQLKKQRMVFYPSVALSFSISIISAVIQYFCIINDIYRLEIRLIDELLLFVVFVNVLWFGVNMSNIGKIIKLEIIWHQACDLKRIITKKIKSRSMSQNSNINIQFFVDINEFTTSYSSLKASLTFLPCHIKLLVSVN